eukprot:14216789-Alexandrium_andersonii.AAC.1
MPGSRRARRIAVLEARAALVSMRRALREPGIGHQRHLRIGDSMATALAPTKGRAAAYDMLR